MIKQAIFFLVFSFISMAQAQAATFYVATNGSDLNSCAQAQNTSTPKRNIMGASGGIACLTAANGDILDIRGGTYSEEVNSSTQTFPSGTSFSNAATIRGHSGETVIIDGILNFGNNNHYWIVRDLIIDGVNYGGGNSSILGVDGNSTNIKFINIEAKRSNYSGQNNRNIAQIGPGSSNVTYTGGSYHDLAPSYISGTLSGSGYQFYIEGNNVIIENAKIFNGPRYGIHNYSGNPGASPSNNTYRFNEVYSQCLNGDNFNSHIIIASGDANAVYGNIVRNGNCHGVSIHGSTNTLVYNNTITQVGEAGIEFFGQSGSQFKNNILIGNSSAFYNPFSESATYAANFCDSVDIGCAFGGDPRFADAVNGDFRLCTGVGAPHASCTGASAALNAGVTLGSPYNVDITGTVRPQGAAYDLGVYESSAAPPGPACSQTPALVAQYSFDNVATDSSGKGNNASLGAGVGYTTGRYNQAVQFPGDAGITVARSESLFLCTGLTISMWVQLPSTVSDFRALVASNYGSTEDGWFLYAGSTGYAQAGAPIGGYCIGDCGSQYGIAVYGVNLTTSWTHVALTWDNSLPSANIKLFINGTQVTSASGTATLADWTGDMCIGCSPFGEYLPNTTVVDEVRIYNYARSGAQILTDMNTPIGALGSTVSFKVGPGTTKKIGPGITEKFGMAP